METENEIYLSIIGHFEGLEREGLYKGNAHHLAQKVVLLVTEGLLSKQQKKIYKHLDRSPKSTKEISKVTNMTSKNVSSILIQLNKNTNLISFRVDKDKPRLKLWYKRNEYYG